MDNPLNKLYIFVFSGPLNHVVSLYPCKDRLPKSNIVTVSRNIVNIYGAFKNQNITNKRCKSFKLIAKTVMRTMSSRKRDKVREGKQKAPGACTIC